MGLVRITQLFEAKYARASRAKARACKPILACISLLAFFLLNAPPLTMLMMPKISTPSTATIARRARIKETFVILTG